MKLESHPPCEIPCMTEHRTGKTKPKTTGIVLSSPRFGGFSISCGHLCRFAPLPPRFARSSSIAQDRCRPNPQGPRGILHAHNAMTANFSDQGMTGSAKARCREVPAMRGPFSVALAGPKEGLSGPWSEIGGRRWGGWKQLLSP